MTTYMQCPKQANLQRQKINQQLPSIGGKEEHGVTINRYGVSFWNDENVLVLDTSDGYANL